MHSPAVYSYVMTNDFRLNQEHPPFIKLLSRLGLLSVRPELPLDSEGWQKAEEPGDPDDGSASFEEDFFNRNANDSFHGCRDRALLHGRCNVLCSPRGSVKAGFKLGFDLRLAHGSRPRH